MIKFGNPEPKKPEAPKDAEKPAEPKPSRATFDRNAYQREYMRKRRAAMKAAR